MYFFGKITFFKINNKILIGKNQYFFQLKETIFVFLKKITDKDVFLEIVK